MRTNYCPLNDGGAPIQLTYYQVSELSLDAI